MEKLCPCGSTKIEENCCLSILSGKKNAAHAVDLMRSRYTAFTQSNMKYLRKTMLPPASTRFNFKDAELWATSVEWLGLKILRTQEGQTHHESGIVEFEATFKENKKTCTYGEISTFKKIKNQWYYLDNLKKWPES